jgi:hypothetical protein
LTLALAALVLVPASAHAGINGQHVSVEGVSQYSVKVCGDNENNTFVCTGIIATPTPVTNIPNYWWKGTILIEGYWDAHGQDYLGTSYCAVPTVWWSDWYNCNTGW